MSSGRRSKVKDEVRLVTAKALAAELGVNRRTVDKFLDEGMPVAHRGRGGRASQFDAEACVAWKADRDAAAAQPENSPVAMFAERARKERAQALLAEQLYAQRAGRLVDVDLVSKKWAGEYAALRTILLASYTTAADRVLRAATLEGLLGVERELKAIAFAALREISDPERLAEPKKRRARRKPSRKRKKA